MWLISLPKCFPQERLWNVTTKWVQEASSGNQMLYPARPRPRPRPPPRLPSEEVVHILALSVPTASPCLCWFLFFPVDLSVQSTTLLSRADLSPFQCKTELFKCQGWKCNCDVAFCIVSKKGSCYFKPVGINFHELEESCVADSVQEPAPLRKI